MQKEVDYFAKNPFNPKVKLSLDLFLDFILYDSKGEAKISKQITLNEQRKLVEIKINEKKHGYMIYQDNEFLTQFSNRIQIYKKKYLIYRNLSEEHIDFEPPLFGVTALGCSHGFDAIDSTSGFIIWVNGKGIMIDPPPYTSHALRS